MLHPITAFIALRYLGAKRKTRFASFVSTVSVLGIALGVAVLIIVSSVMNGFEKEVTRHILGMTSHAMLFRPGSRMDDWHEVLEIVEAEPGVVAGAPFIRAGAMLNHKGNVRGVSIQGIDIDAERLELMREHGAELTCEAGESRALRKQIAAWAKAEGYPTRGWRIFETSGSAAGQKLAFGLLNHGAHLGVVGYTRDPVEIRLSNIMAFAATARGTWGCLPEHYPDVIDLVLNGEIRLDPFVERRAMSTINDTFDDLHRHALKRRPVLVPDFSRSDR